MAELAALLSAFCSQTGESERENISRNVFSLAACVFCVKGTSFHSERQRNVIKMIILSENGIFFGGQGGWIDNKCE
jgi:hypothetical protein